MPGSGGLNASFAKTLVTAVFAMLRCVNDREKGKKAECAAIMTVFRRNPDVV
jgi:hypothetical protein